MAGRKGKKGAKGNTRRTPQGKASRAEGSDQWLWGLHSVAAALGNPERTHSQFLATAKAAAALKEQLGKFDIQPQIVEIRAIEQIAGRDAVHQGVALRTSVLPVLEVEDIMASGKTLMLLDQVTDPQNVGAIMRSCAAFDVGGLILQDRHAPSITGVLAKAASGAVETVPMVHVTNLTRALETLKAAGYWSVGLAGEATNVLGEADLPSPLVIVMGAEGAGLRRLTRDYCDLLIRIPMTPEMESLNVSAAAAVTLFTAYSRTQHKSD